MFLVRSSTDTLNHPQKFYMLLCNFSCNWKVLSEPDNRLYRSFEAFQSSAEKTGIYIAIKHSRMAQVNLVEDSL